MTFIFGIIAVVALFVTQNSDWTRYVNPHGLYLVVGGTVCVLFMLTPTQTVKSLFQVLFSMWKDGKGMGSNDLKGLLKNPSAPVSDPHGVINLARDLWEMQLTEEQYEDLLFNHAESVLNKNVTAINCLRNLGKYPPALGMVGTVMGMIQLFGGLGGGSQQNQVGGQLALAMTATLYGLVLSNYVLMPMADRLEARKEIAKAEIEQTIKVLMSIRHQQPKFLTERLIDAA
jgi:chemotaxis protein MotA